MSRWDDFFTETPPAEHLDRVLKAAQPELQKLKTQQQQKRRFFLQIPLFAGAGVFSALMAIWFLRPWPRQEVSTDVLAGLEVSEVNVELLLQVESAEEVEFLAELEMDSLEFFEHLELLENLEESEKTTDARKANNWEDV